MEEALELVFHMNGGTGKSSYAENSSLRRLIIQKSQHILEESIRELLLWQGSSSLPKCLNIADLGCSSGPNAFFVVKEIIKSINKTCCQQQLNHQPPSVQVFLNDLIANDFNTLFKMLPSFYDELEKLEGMININIGGEGGNNRSRCYVAAVPGSFYGRLFPDDSIHLLHSSSSLHWLSQVPVGLVSKSGEPLNKKNICIVETSPPSVRQAYMDQFENDFTMFLKMRSLELVPKGHMVLTFLCKNNEDDGLGFLEVLGNTIQDMVCMGVIEERQLAAINVPLYAPSIEELKQIIEVEGSFTLRRLETFKSKLDANSIDNGQTREMNLAMCIRVGIEPFLTSYFDENCMNDLFKMYGENISKNMENEKGIVNNVTLLLVKEPK